MASTTTRKLEAYTIHAKENDTSVDYNALLASLAAVPSPRRYWQRGSRVVFVPVVRVQGDRVFLQAYEGTEELYPLIFDRQTAQAEVQRLSRYELMVTPTHAVLGLESRALLVEYNHAGAKATSLAQVIQEVGIRELGRPNLEVHVTPVIDEDFVKAVERFIRIRVASIRITEPNQDWNDAFVELLSELGQRSEGRHVEAAVTAHRGRSLARETGIVQSIKTMVRRSLPILSNARVEGVREGETQPTAVSSRRFIEHQRVSVRRTEDGYVESEDIWSKLSDYLSGRSSRQQDD